MKNYAEFLAEISSDPLARRAFAPYQQQGREIEYLEKLGAAGAAALADLRVQRGMPAKRPDLITEVTTDLKGNPLPLPQQFIAINQEIDKAQNLIAALPKHGTSRDNGQYLASYNASRDMLVAKRREIEKTQAEQEQQAQAQSQNEEQSYGNPQQFFQGNPSNYNLMGALMPQMMRPIENLPSLPSPAPKKKDEIFAKVMKYFDPKLFNPEQYQEEV